MLTGAICYTFNISDTFSNLFIVGHIQLYHMHTIRSCFFQFHGSGTIGTETASKHCGAASIQMQRQYVTETYRVRHSHTQLLTAQSSFTNNYSKRKNKFEKIFTHTTHRQ